MISRRNFRHKDKHITMSRTRRQTLAGLATVVALAGAVAGCNSPTLVVLEDPRTYIEDRSLRDAREDARIRLDIQALFAERESGELRNVEVEVYERAVLLVGTVTTPAARSEAGALVARIEGVGRILNEIQVVGDAGVQATAADLTIETRIKQALRADDDVHSANLRWASVNGIVYLFGRALSEAERDRAVAIVRDIDGVREVVDHTKVVPLED